ncbi:MAG: hypothetical protein JOZ99_13015 [Actinobacteria bacterium]|nr:hypothetical protein [Actinomycetota bacterium]
MFRRDVVAPAGAGPYPIVSAVAAHAILWRASVCTAPCPLVLADLHTSVQRELGGPPGLGSPSDAAAQFSPDGALLAVATRRVVPGRPSPVADITVFDTVTGAPVWHDETDRLSTRGGRQSSTPGIVSSLVWDPSSRWLFFTVDSRLLAHRIGRQDDMELGAFAPAAAFDAG